MEKMVHGFAVQQTSFLCPLCPHTCSYRFCDRQCNSEATAHRSRTPWCGGCPQYVYNIWNDAAMGFLIHLVFSVTPEFNSAQATFVDHLQCSIHWRSVVQQQCGQKQSWRHKIWFQSMSQHINCINSDNNKSNNYYHYYILKIVEGLLISRHYAKGYSM